MREEPAGGESRDGPPGRALRRWWDPCLLVRSVPSRPVEVCDSRQSPGEAKGFPGGDGRRCRSVGAMPGLGTVIFDVDGTLVDSERDGHRIAFNQAFAEFGLPDRWDEGTYGRLLAITGGQRRLHAYLSERGVGTAERDDLVPRLHARKTELFMAMAEAGEVPARPGTRRLLDELAAAGVTVAVATTGSRAWVAPLLDGLFDLSRFTAVVTGDDCPRRKPEPDAYLAALRAVGAGPGTTVAVEDSDNGVRAARAAGLAVAAVTNDYTAPQELAGAAVVLDGFGTPARPAAVRRDSYGVLDGGVLTAAALDRLVAAASRGSTSAVSQ